VSSKVILHKLKPNTKYDLEAITESLEKEVYKTSKSENKNNIESGPAEIQTQDLSRVKAICPPI